MAAILRHRHSYDHALESFSKPLAELIEWRATPEGEIVVSGKTADLYRYFAATLLAEYLYERVADTIRLDLKEELDSVSVYDEALGAVLDIVDIPDRRASLFVRLYLQPGGRLSRSKRATFPEFTDEEIIQLESAVIYGR